MHPSTAARKFIAAAFLCLGISLAVADQSVTVSPKAPLFVKGDLAAKQEESWKVMINGGKEVRVSVAKGKRGVVVDIYDAQGITANEGVAEADWFPVATGQYKITVTNITALGSKSGGQNVVYEVKIEVR